MRPCASSSGFSNHQHMASLASFQLPLLMGPSLTQLCAAAQFSSRLVLLYVKMDSASSVSLNLGLAFFSLGE